MITYQLLSRKCRKALVSSNTLERIYPECFINTLKTLFHLYIHILNIVILCGVHVVVLCLIVYYCCKKAILDITNSKWNTHTASLLHKLHILSLYRLNDYQIGSFMYRCMNALLPDGFCHMFAKNADFHSYGTRNRDTVHMTTSRLNLRKHSIRFFCPKLWNCLPLKSKY